MARSPDSGGSVGYLSPEPLLQSPTWVASRLRSGVQTPSYSYAANNPVYFVDPDGLDVTNGTGRTMWVKPEDSSEPVELPPGGTFPGPQDGFTHPDRPGEVFKTVDNQDAQCGPNQKVSTAPNPAIRNQSVKTLKSNWGQSLKGGWKKPDFAQKHPDWAPLFRKAGSRP